MRVAVKPPPGGAKDRTFRYRPKDPYWASAEMVERVLGQLHLYDPYLSLWWEPFCRAHRTPEMPGRWRVVRWMFEAGTWDRVFYWEGESGEYRDPEPVLPMLERLKRMDVPLAELDRQLDDENDRRSSLRSEEVRAGLREFAEDYTERFGRGVRQTFGGGHIRSRASINLAQTPSHEHVRWLVSQGMMSVGQAMAMGVKL
jgi:hypothetical protein